VTNSGRQTLVSWPEPTTTGDLSGPARSVYANSMHVDILFPS